MAVITAKRRRVAAVGTGARDNLLAVIAGAYLALFTGVWIWIGVKLLLFDPERGAGGEAALMSLGTLQATVAGFLATSVSSLAAGMMGVEFQRAQTTADTRIASRAEAAFAGSKILSACVVNYLIVGGFVLICALARENQAPDMVKTFAISTMGFLAGGLASCARAGEKQG